MGLAPEDGLYFASMIPSERGFLWSLADCYFGDEDKGRKPIKDFVQEMDNNPQVWKVAQRIEGLINRRGVHPAGVAIFNDGEIFSQTSTMIAPGGQRTTQYDLESAERLGVVKYDLLATDAIDGIQTDLFLLIENGYIDWDTDLRTTYNNVLHPEVIDYQTLKMWEMVHRKEIISTFQFSDSPVGEQAMEEVKPTSLLELGTINATMRLTAADHGEMPIVKYRHHKENINLWYQEMENAGLNGDEISILKSYLQDTYGMCITQEQLMIMTQDPKIANFSFLDSDKARKILAKLWRPL
jgi:DNA polymerase-3 subunit alpha